MVKNRNLKIYKVTTGTKQFTRSQLKNKFKNKKYHYENIKTNISKDNFEGPQMDLWRRYILNMMFSRNKISLDFKIYKWDQKDQHTKIDWFNKSKYDLMLIKS